MSYGQQNPWSVPGSKSATAGAVDLGLRQYMLRVYNYMATGLAVTGAVAWLAADTGIYAQIAHTPLMFLVIFAPLVMVFVISARINSMSLGAAQMSFWAYAALMGLSLGFIFLAYTGSSIALTFFISASTFLGMSLYGYTTKADLTRFGSFLVMGLFGLIIATLVNIFLQSPAIYFATSAIGVLLFTGLTAYDTQTIRQQYDYTRGYGADVVGRTAIMGALRLYLDFVNLFMFLLQFFGQRRN